MTALLDDLLATLTAEADHLRRLHPLLEEERAALLAFDARGVAKVTGEKEVVLSELKRLDAARLVCVRRLAAALGVPVETLTLSAVARLTGASERFQALGQALRADLVKVTAVNDRNRSLAEHSLHHVRALLDTIRASLQEAPTYGARGRQAESATARPVLNRTA
jgi:flagellar biosynthesis/type III secretory pathway chaperone